MSHQLNRLLKAFRQAEQGPPADLQKFLANLPEPGALTSPWDTWALIGLVRYRRIRQQWASQFVRTVLRREIAKSVGMKSAHDVEEQQVWGTVPDRPDWNYIFYGDIYAFKNQETKEVVEISYFNYPPEYTYLNDYLKNLENLCHPEPEEIRLKELYPELSVLDLACDDLIAAKALKRLPRKWPPRVRVCEKVLAIESAIESFLRVWREPNQRVWLSALIGDWLAADAFAVNLPEIQRMTGKRKEQTERLRRVRLETGKGIDEFHELFGLAQLGAADGPLVRAFQDRPSELSLAALKVVEEQKDGRWCFSVHDLVLRLHPDGRFPEPEIWIECVKYLLKYGFERKVVLEALLKTGHELIGDALLLALEHAPELAIPLSRKGLRSETPYCREQTAMILAFVDRDWSRRELLQLLMESKDRIKTRQARAALSELEDLACKAALRAWEKRNLLEEEPGSMAGEDGTGSDLPQNRTERAELESCRVRMRELREMSRVRLTKIRDQ